MQLKDKIIKYLVIGTFLILAVLFVIKFTGGSFLRLYVETGIGTCKKIPILCMGPTEEVKDPQIDSAYLTELIPYEFPEVKISIPKGFRVVKEEIKRPYYKNKMYQKREQTIYIVAKDKNFFLNLFPEVKGKGIKNNYEFYTRVIHANLNKINNLTDMFFVIIKSIFTPDIGNQATARIIRYTSGDQKGFISYNLINSRSYFDCIVFDKDNNFFKLYAKDTLGKLDLYKIYTILSTLKLK
jgi:hypothetical protein